MRLSIATKIFVAFAALVVVFTGVLMFGVYRTQKLFDRIERLNRRIVPVSLALSDAQADLNSFNILLHERDPLVVRRTLQAARLGGSLPERILERVSRAADLFAGSSPTVAADSDRIGTVRSRLTDLRGDVTRFADLAERFSQRVLDENRADTADGNEELRRLQKKLRRRAGELDARISTLREDLRSLTDRALDRANQNERSSVYALGGLSLLALLVSVGVLLALVRVIRPLTDLTDAARRIGEGDYSPLDEPPEAWFGPDEVTLLAREFNAMAEKLDERDRKLREQHEALLKSERLATIGQMTSAVTHELRNPLSSINLNTEMLADALVDKGIDPDDPDVVPLLETITEEVDRLHDITEEYLVYARLPSAELAEEDLADIVTSLVDFHRSEWRSRGVEVALDVPDEAVPVRADANQLRQGLLNIVENAIEASPAETSVDVVVSTDDGRASVAVRDRGPGIDPDIRGALFEPFETTKSDGTGLGLAMTRQIVEQHHGEVRVEEPDGPGARFVIELPVASEAPETASQASSLLEDSDA